MKQPRIDEVWKSPELAKKFLARVRKGVPLAKEQIEVMMCLIASQGKSPSRFLDLGSGNGILSSAILHKYPKSKGVLLDFSDTMLDAAKENLQAYSKQLVFQQTDYAHPNWVRGINKYAPFDIIVSGFSIHHQPDTRKKSIYKEIFSLLKRGGWFINIEHVASLSKLSGSIWDDYMINSLYIYNKSIGSKKTQNEIAKEYYHRPDKKANLLSPVELQCDWLRNIGFTDVDTYFKIFELSVFAGRKG